MTKIKSYYCADVKCPFYKGDDGHSVVVCEGIENATTLKLSFYVNTPLSAEEKDKFRKHIFHRCTGNFKACPLYRLILEENYPEENK